jgi:hypothetical protein
MAATVLTGTGDFSYTNSTGGNVRVIINYFGAINPSDRGTFPSEFLGIQIWTAGATIISYNATALGRSLATASFQIVPQAANVPVAYDSSINMSVKAGSIGSDNSQAGVGVLPTEIYLAPTQAMSISKLSGYSVAQYNILVIPENG